MHVVHLTSQEDWNKFVEDKTCNGTNAGARIASLSENGETTPKRFPCSVFYTGVWSPSHGTVFKVKFAY